MADSKETTSILPAAPPVTEGGKLVTLESVVNEVREFSRQHPSCISVEHAGNVIEWLEQLPAATLPSTSDATAATSEDAAREKAIGCPSTHCNRREECASPNDCIRDERRNYLAGKANAASPASTDTNSATSGSGDAISAKASKRLTTAHIVAMSLGSTGITEGGISDAISQQVWNDLHEWGYARTVTLLDDERGTIGTDAGDKALRDLLALDAAPRIAASPVDPVAWRVHCVDLEPFFVEESELASRWTAVVGAKVTSLYIAPPNPEAPKTEATVSDREAQARCHHERGEQ